CNLIEQLQPLSARFILEIREARGVSARTGQLFDEPCPDRIDHLHEHYRDGAGCLQKRPRSWAARRQNDIRRERHQLYRSLANAQFAPAAPPRATGKSPTSAPAHFCRQLKNSCSRGWPAPSPRLEFLHPPTPPHPLALLRPRRSRPRDRRAAERG